MMNQIPLFDIPAKPATRTLPKPIIEGKPSVVEGEIHVRQVITLARRVMGRIDLDAHSLTPDVAAKVRYTPKQKALTKEWSGNVWLNAPTGRALPKWIDKLCDTFEDENSSVTEALILVPARFNAGWWARLGKYPFCALKGRLRILKMSRGEIREAYSTQPGAVVYLGSQFMRFYNEFHGVGTVYAPYKVNTPDYGR
jgi:hypothetical protein